MSKNGDFCYTESWLWWFLRVCCGGSKNGTKYRIACPLLQRRRRL